MSDDLQQIRNSIKIIEEQLAIIRQMLGNPTEITDGVMGVFDGEFMVSEDGKKYQIPPNYASKSMLVVGDTIKMVEDSNGGPAKFKQIDKVERVKLEGVLAKKDGKYEVLTDVGSFKVLPVAVKHYNGESGDRVKIQIPRQHAKGGWAAFEKVIAEKPDILDVPQVLLNQAAPLVESAGQGNPPINDVVESGQKPGTTENTSSASPENAKSSNKKSKSRKKKKKSATTSSDSSPKNNTTAPVSATPSSSPSNQELVEVVFDEDDLV